MEKWNWQVTVAQELTVHTIIGETSNIELKMQFHPLIAIASIPNTKSCTG